MLVKKMCGLNLGDYGVYYGVFADMGQSKTTILAFRQRRWGQQAVI